MLTPHSATAAKGVTLLLLPHHTWGCAMLVAMAQLGRSVRRQAAAEATKAARVDTWGVQWSDSVLLWLLGRVGHAKAGRRYAEARWFIRYTLTEVKVSALSIEQNIYSPSLKQITCKMRLNDLGQSVLY